MARTIRGTNRADRIEQNNRPELTIRALGGNDTVILDRDDDLGGRNFVDAGTGNDKVLNTFEGANRILMGAGNDTYIGTGFDLNFADRVEGGAGNDRFFVQTNISTYLGGVGNDTFFTNGHKNDFNGGQGIDTISYEFRHEDSVVGDEGVTISLGEKGALTGSNSLEELISIENAIGSLNSDIVGGSSGNNRLLGLAGDDDLHGLGGRDILVGGLGKDFLFGGAAADRFVFARINESPLGDADEIKDFSRAAGDRIDLKAIDANRDLGGNQAFEFIGGNAFSGDGGQIRLESGVLLIDTGGSSAPDMVIGVDNVASMQASDFIL